MCALFSRNCISHFFFLGGMYNIALKAAAFISLCLSLNLFASPGMEYQKVPSDDNPELLKLGKILFFFFFSLTLFFFFFFVRERKSEYIALHVLPTARNSVFLLLSPFRLIKLPFLPLPSPPSFSNTK